MKWQWKSRRKRMLEGLDQDIRDHIERETQDNIDRGMSPAEARRAARLKFGNVALAKEDTRAVWTVLWLENLLQDLRLALRMLRKSPGFTVVAILTLALGIGANTAIFSLFDAVMLRSLPVRDPQHLVLLEWHAHHSPRAHLYSSFGDCTEDSGMQSASGCSFSYPMLEQIQAQTKVYGGMIAFGSAGQVNLSGNGPASIVRGELVSGNFFQALGVPAAAGRTLDPSDDHPGSAPVVELSYGLWQGAFGGSTSVVGRTIRLNNSIFTIVGVAGARFPGLTPGSVYDLWIPLSQAARLNDRYSADRQRDPGDWWLVIVGRLNPRVSLAQAQAATALLFRNEVLHGAKPLFEAKDDPSVTLVPAQEGLNGRRAEDEIPLFVLMLAVGIVLLIACANVAGLLLARSTARQKEVALRLALGASRARIVRQLLTESNLLAAFGGLLGCLFAYWGVHAIAALLAGGSSSPFPFTVAPDLRVLAFTGAISILTGTLAGLVPAFRGTRVDLTPSLKEGARGSSDTGHAGSHWLSTGNVLVVAQVALGAVVLCGAGLLVRTLENLQSVNPGFDTRNVLLFGADPTLLGYQDARIQNLYRTLRERLAALPGVISASYSSSALLSGNLWGSSVHIDGQPRNSDVEVDMFAAGPGFFGTLRIPLVAGRYFDCDDFARADVAAAAQRQENAVKTPKGSAVSPTLASKAPSAASSGAPPPTHVLVNLAFVRRYLNGKNPLGVRLNDGSEIIVGVVGDAKYNSLRRAVHPTLYVPLTAGGAYFELRTALDPRALVPEVRRVVAGVDPDLPLFDVRTQTEQIQLLLFEQRSIARLSSFFGLLALLLACIGLYGLLSYEVTRRTREIGIRTALGAQRSDVMRLVLRQGIALAIVGATGGIVISLGLTRFLAGLLYGVSPTDPMTFAGVAVVLAAVALLACWIPARRATRIDPNVALRYE